MDVDPHSKDYLFACASTLYKNGHGTEIAGASDPAVALMPLTGPLTAQVFAFGLFVASIFAAVILPVATAFYVCEAFGIVNNKDVMGEYVNKRIGNIIGWITIMVLIGLTAAMFVTSLM